MLNRTKKLIKKIENIESIDSNVNQKKIFGKNKFNKRYNKSFKYKKKDNVYQKTKKSNYPNKETSAY